jgi:hypothetical protein
MIGTMIILNLFKEDVAAIHVFIEKDHEEQEAEILKKVEGNGE